MLARIILSLALMGFLFKFRKQIPVGILERAVPARTPIILFAVFFLIYLVLKFNRHLSLHTFGFDLSAFDYAYYNAIHHGTLYTPFFGKSYLAEHFFPSMLLALPIHALLPYPETLLVFQAMVVSAAAIPFYLVAEKLARQKAVALILTLCLMRNPYILSGVVFDYHVEMLQPLLICLMVLSALEAQRFRFCLWGLLFVFTKENEWLAMLFFAVAFWFCFNGKRFAWLTLILSFVGGILVFLVVRHSLGSGFEKYLARYGAYGKSPWSVATFMVSHPGVLFSENVFHQALRLIAPTACLSFLSPFSIAALPDFFIHSLSGAEQQRTLALYYGAGITTILFLGTAHAYGWLKGRWGRGWFPAILLLPVIVFNSGYFRLLPQRGYEKAAINMCKSVPLNQRTAAPNELIPHLRRQEGIISSIFLNMQDACNWDYIILNRLQGSDLENQVVSKGCFELQQHAGPYVLYARKR